MSLQERYTHYDCLLPLAFQFVSGILVCYYVHRESDIAWELFNIYEYNINQADNWLLIGLICTRSDLLCGIDLLSTGISSFSLSAAGSAWPAPASHRGKLFFSLTPPHHWKAFCAAQWESSGRLQHWPFCGKNIMFPVSGGPLVKESNGAL